MPYFLRTPRLGFRRWMPEDFPLALQLWGDAEVTRLFDARSPLSEAQVRERFQRELSAEVACGLQYWPLFLLETGEFVGCCGLKPSDLERGDWEMGFHLRPAFWGMGLATEAGTAVIRHAFDVLGANALVAGHHPENANSGKALKKLGFCYWRDNFFPPTGRMHPLYVLERSASGEGFSPLVAKI